MSIKNDLEYIKVCSQCGLPLTTSNKICEYCGFENNSIIKDDCLFNYNCKECDNLVKYRNSMMLDGEDHFCKLGFELNKEIVNILDERKYFMGSYQSNKEASEDVYDCRDLYYDPHIVKMDINKFNLFMKKKSNILK